MPLQAGDALFTPDAGDGKQPYTCSYHTLRLADGRLLVLDIVRSDDTHQRALRVFLSDRDGNLRTLSVAGPSDTWSPFVTTPAQLDRSRNVIARGPHWVAGDVRRGDSPDLGLQHVAFELELRVDASALRSDTLGLAFLRMTVEDHPRVHHRGWLEVDGEHITIDGPGAVSVHIGEKLCQYAYVVTPPTDAPTPGILLASVGGDDFCHLGALLGNNTATYSYGSHGVPALSLNIGAFTHPLKLSPGGHHIHFTPIGTPVLHTLLGVPTITTLARGRYHETNLLGPDDSLDLGELILEGRGAPFYAVIAAIRPA
jgi:hypothetical protein